MSIADEIVKSPKVTGTLAMSVAKMGDGETGSLLLIFRASAALPLRDGKVLTADGKPVDGVEVRADAGTLYTGRATLAGVRNLVDDERITSISGSRPIQPAGMGG